MCPNVWTAKRNEPEILDYLCCFNVKKHVIGRVGSESSWSKRLCLFVTSNFSFCLGFYSRFLPETDYQRLLVSFDTLGAVRETLKLQNDKAAEEKLLYGNKMRPLCGYC